MERGLVRQPRRTPVSAAAFQNAPALRGQQPAHRGSHGTEKQSRESGAGSEGGKQREVSWQI